MGPYGRQYRGNIVWFYGYSTKIMVAQHSVALSSALCGKALLISIKAALYQSALLEARVAFGFRVSGSGFKVWGLGFRVQGLGFKV